METNEQQKILLVGTERNCRSIGYVLDFKDYVMVEKLTTKNFAQHKDYQIYICELKHKSQKLIDRKLLKANIDVQYLDDICRKIDEYYTAEHNKGTKTEPTQKPIKTETNQKAQQVTEPVPHVSLIKRIIRGMKHPLRAAWHVVLRLRRFISLKIIKNKIKHYAYKKYDYHYTNYLRDLSPSELLLYILNAPINRQINCANWEKNAEIFVWANGDVSGCCRCLIPFGNLIKDHPDEILNGIYARIVKLSSLNQSYCLCPVDCCSYTYYKVDNTPFKIENLDLPDLTRKLTLSFDPSCNLACKSCRKEHYVMDEEHHQIASIITKKLLELDWLERADSLSLASLGEVFYSPYYRQLLTTNLKRKEISIYSNGILFNETNWQLIANKYETINVRISVDAATKETYQKIRAGNFDVLMKNLKMLGDLRRQKKIKTFDLCFVVQRENFREMPAFIELAIKLGVDRIPFQKLNNWVHLPEQEYLKKCLIVDDEYFDYDLWCVLQDPIFKNPKPGTPSIELFELNRYVAASDKLYRKRYDCQ